MSFPRIAIAITAAAALALLAEAVPGQDQPATLQKQKKKKGPEKDRSLGYDDTPIIPGQKWRVHDSSRPRPRMITPGAQYGQPPSDAVVLFNGKDLSQWVTNLRGQVSEPKWKVENGYTEVVPRTGGITTKEKFGDIQLHVEWATPAEVSGKGQGRGNSGIILMSRYEVQVLDSWDNPTSGRRW